MKKHRDVLIWMGKPVEELTREELIEGMHCLAETARAANLRHERQISWYREMLRKKMDQ